MRKIGYLLVFVLFITCKNKDKVLKDYTLINAVPVSSTVIIETKSLEKLQKELYQSKLWGYTKILDWNQKATLLFAKIATIIPTQEFDSNFMLSISLSGGSSFDYLLLKYVPTEEEKEYANRLKSSYTESFVSYDGVNLYTLEKENKKTYFAIHKNILLLSEQKLLVEEGIRQLNSKVSILSNADFAKLYETVDSGKDANIFIQYKDLNQLATNYVQKGSTTWMKNLGDWTAFDVAFSDNLVEMDGKTLANFINATYFTVFKDLKPQSKTILEKLPNATQTFIYTALDNYMIYNKNYDRYLNSSQILFKKQQNIAKYNPSVVKSFQKIIGNEMVTAFFSERTPEKPAKLVFLNCTSDTAASGTLKSLSSGFPINYRGYMIQQLAYETVLQDALGNQASDVNFPYYIMIDKVAIFGGSLELLKSYINEIIADHYFLKVPENKDFIAEFDTEAHIFAMANGAESLSLIQAYLDPIEAGKLQSNIPKMLAINYIGFQLTFEGESGKTQTKIQFGNVQASMVQQVGNFSMPAAPKKIEIVTNHLTQEREIMVQDAQNQLFLVSKSGNLVFTKKLEEPIISSINQVDLLKNNRLQYIFNTPTKLYIVDRNGAEVKPFPITLKGTATAGFGLFDYEGNKNYRFAIPIGEKLVMYAANGSQVRDFAYIATVPIAKSPIWWRENGKDYIITATADGEILVLNRKGEKAIIVKNKFEVRGDLQIINHKITFYTTDNHIVDIDFSGKIAIDDSNTDYQQIQLNPWGIIRMDNTKLEWKGMKNISLALKRDDEYAFDVYADEKTTFLVAINNTTKQIEVLDSEEKVLAGFPIYGDHFGKIFKEGYAFYLVTEAAADKNLMIYKVK